MTGLRKMMFGAWAFTLTWAFAMWAPGITEASRKEALLLQGSIVTLIIGANMYVHRQQRKALKPGAEPRPSGDGTAPPPNPGIGSPAETPNQ